MKTLRRLRARMRAEGYTNVRVVVARDLDEGGYTCVVRRGLAHVTHGWGRGRSRAEAVRAAFAGRVLT